MNTKMLALLAPMLIIASAILGQDNIRFADCAPNKGITEWGINCAQSKSSANDGVYSDVAALCWNGNTPNIYSGAVASNCDYAISMETMSYAIFGGGGGLGGIFTGASVSNCYPDISLRWFCPDSIATWQSGGCAASCSWSSGGIIE